MTTKVEGVSEANRGITTANQVDAMTRLMRAIAEGSPAGDDFIARRVSQLTESFREIAPDLSIKMEIRNRFVDNMNA